VRNLDSGRFQGPLYLIGASHPQQADAKRLLENLISDRQRLVADAELLQDEPP
jgi:hypothetical protein